MVVVVVEFPTQGTPPDDMVEKFRGTVPKYEKLDGLIRKYYTLTQDGKRAGGIYLWESEEKARAWYTEEWQQYMKSTWGETPSVRYLDCPIVVDNEKG